MKAVQDWLSGRADTRLGRLALQWFRAYFEASRNSGCAATVYSTLSVLPAALVAVAYFHSSGSDTNAFVERLITHLKLTGATAGLVQDTFGSASSNALAATITVVDQLPHLGHRNRPDLPGRLRPRLGDRGRVGGRPGAVRDLLLRNHRRRRSGSRFGRGAPRCRLARSPARLARRVDGLLALGAALPPAPKDRCARPTTRRPPRHCCPRRRSRHRAVLPGASVEREREDLRLVRRRGHAGRLHVHHDHDVAGLRGLLPGLGQLAPEPSDNAATAAPPSRREAPPRALSSRRCLLSIPATSPTQMELPPPRRTLLQRLTHWLEHAQALRRWIEEARGRSAALDATFETIERDSNIGGGLLAGALSYRLFVFALPLAFFVVSASDFWPAPSVWSRTWS